VGRHKERGNGDEVDGCIFVSMYENRKMKAIEIILRKRGKWEKGERWRG
jgi:uncharacterized protein YuzE